MLRGAGLQTRLARRRIVLRVARWRPAGGDEGGSGDRRRPRAHHTRPQPSPSLPSSRSRRPGSARAENPKQRARHWARRGSMMGAMSIEEEFADGGYEGKEEETKRLRRILQI